MLIAANVNTSSKTKYGVTDFTELNSSSENNSPQPANKFLVFSESLRFRRHSYDNATVPCLEPSVSKHARASWRRLSSGMLLRAAWPCGLRQQAPLRNVSKLLPDYTTQHPTGQPSSYTPPWEPENSPSQPISLSSTTYWEYTLKHSLSSDENEYEKTKGECQLYMQICAE
jgi:hypothetical protein